MLRRNPKGALFLGFTLATALVAGGCKRSHDADAKPDEQPPALVKLAEQQGDATKAGRLQKQEAPAESRDKPLATAVDASRDEKPAKDSDDDGDDDGKRGAKSSAKDTSDKGEGGRDVDASSTEEKSATKLAIKRIQFAEEITKREPVNAEETFSAAQTQKLYAFVEIDNPDKKRSRIVVTFVPPMGSPSKVELRVGDKSRWRTWALRRSVKAVGTWNVIVSDTKGGEIGRRSFEVTE